MAKKTKRLSNDSYAQLGVMGVRAITGELLESAGEVRIERTADPDWPWLLTDLKRNETVKLASLVEAVDWVRLQRERTA